MSSSRKEISVDVRELIIKYQSEGKSLREIGRLVGKSHATVQTVLKNYKTNGSLSSKQRSGRPKIFTPREEVLIERKIKKDPKLTASEIAAELLEETGKSCEANTIRRVLKRKGYHSRTARKKPFISEKNRRKRLEFARSHEKYGNEFWSKVIFSDESKFNIYNNDGRTKVWRKPNTALEKSNMVGTVKHGGGNILVWGCMSEAGVGNLVFIESTMDRFMYLNILKNNLKNSASKLGLGESFIFQQDNDPKHTSRLVQEWLVYNTRQLRTPPQSPDMNPIEHLWDELGRRLKKRHIRSKSELKTALEEEWAQIQPSVTKKLVESMPRRMKAVINSKGNATSY